MLYLHWTNAHREVICEDCREEMHIPYAAVRKLTEEDCLDSIDTVDNGDGGTNVVMHLKPVCSYCGWEADIGDLPDGT